MIRAIDLAVSSIFPLRSQLVIDPFCEKYLEQRLIGDIPLVGQQFQVGEHMLGHPDRDGLE